MRTVNCEKCGGEFPTNDTLTVHQSVVCRTCAESIFKEEKITANQVQRQADPTVCIGCGQDNGDIELPKLAGLPVCPNCEAFYRNRPFPVWVKAALVGMIILVVSALVWNSRFISAYYELRCFGSALTAGDFERGAEFFISASKRVPENGYIQNYAKYYEGVLLLNQDKSAEALKMFQSCRGKLDADSDVDLLIMQAQIGVAFDKGNYDEFLRLALELDKQLENDPTIVGQVASAYACKYAETQDEQYKIKSLEALGRAGTIASTIPDYQEQFNEYEQRILHRLYTREIIDRNEFKKKYPNGWTQEGGEI